MDTIPPRPATPPLVLADLDPEVAEALAARAARLGRTPEAEAAAILREGLGAELVRAVDPPRTGEELVAAIRRRFGPEHGFDLELPPREMIGEPRVRFD